jgi:signal transduction histidine kinase
MAADDHPKAADRGLTLHVGLAALLGCVTTLIWGASSGTSNYYWPVWVWLGLGVILGLHVAVLIARRTPSNRRAIAVHAWLTGLLDLALVVVWLAAGDGTFWAGWPLLFLQALLAVHALIAFRHMLPPLGRQRELEQRVDELSRTRRGALDAQATQLRRIERDLHDGAQARLVALSLQLGRAEERLRDDPETAVLVRQAREEATAAIGELRSLARGIAPPILSDRGLAAAVEALAIRAPGEVTVSADPGPRAPVAIETAAYFVVAESLTNVAKHAPGASATVSIRRTNDDLIIEVTDDGPGGARSDGSGLTGLRRRVAALDGELKVTSPPGSGTTIHAELSCGS